MNKYIRHKWTPTWIVILILLIGCNTAPKESSLFQHTVKKAWEGIAPDFRIGDISSDGKYFTDINWTTGNLVIIDVEKDTIYPLEGNGYNEGGYSWMSSISNKGDQLAFEWFNYEAGSHELRLYSMTSKNVKTLKEASSEFYYMEPLEWKKEDDSLLIAKNKEGSNWEMGFISANDGGYRPVIELNWNSPGGKNPFAYPYAVLSSDNSFIGFDYRLKSSESMDLFIASTSTGELYPLWEGKGDDRFLFWDNKDQYVYFYSDRSGTPAVWKLAVREGKASGDPLLVLDDITGLTAIGKTNKGFAYGKISGDFNTYYTVLDLKNGKILEKPRKVDSILHYRNNVGTWSKEGDSLMYVQFKSMPGGRESLVIKSIKDGGQREVMFPWQFHNKTGTVAWPYRNTVIIDGSSPEHFGLHTLDLNSGEVSAAFDHGERGFFQRFETNSNGSRYFIEMRRGQPGVVAMDPETSTIQQVISGPVVASSTTVSPDDRLMAFLRNNPSNNSTNIEVLNLNTNELWIIASHEQGILSNPLTWASDSNSLLVGVSLPNNKRGIWSIALDNPSEPVFIDLPEAYNTTLIASPNGRHFAYQGGTVRGEMFYLKGE